MFVVKMVIGLALVVEGHYTHLTEPKKFFQSCHVANKSVCQSYQCLTHYQELDLRQLDKLPCHRDSDCLFSRTGFTCVHYQQGRKGFCECPSKKAYNATSCTCQKAKTCPIEGRNNTFCHNGMRCGDKHCSCTDLTKTLFEPVGRFCVLPLGDSEETYLEDRSSEQQRTFLVILCVIGGFFCLGVIAIVVYVCTENTTCAKGDYECEDEKEEGNESHIAAWDMPTLDYLSEEQTMKYLKRHHDWEFGNSDPLTSTENNQPEVSSSTPTSSGGSLPESDQYSNRLQQQHINLAYVEDHDAIRRTSDAMDV